MCPRVLCPCEGFDDPPEKRNEITGARFLHSEPGTMLKRDSGTKHCYWAESQRRFRDAHVSLINSNIGIKQINSEVVNEDVQEMQDSRNQDELIEIHEQEQDIQELKTLVHSEDQITIGN
ncbi:hypothetical protein TNCV_3777451 [Trichonephila clavipes]|nr:hypothetical protein TNCV_3777451 [Trichonephila clavipes]